MSLSNNGLSVLKKHEGRSLTSYPDGEGYSIGYGHFILPDEQHLIDQTITVERAEELLKQDVKKAERCVNSGVNVPLEQNQYDALVSFAYNVGCGAFSSSTLLKKVNQTDHLGAACEFLKWIYTTQNGVKVPLSALKRRRVDEQHLYYASNPDCGIDIADEDIDRGFVPDSDDNEYYDAPINGGGYTELPYHIQLTIEEALIRSAKGLVDGANRLARLGDKNAMQGYISAITQNGVFANDLPVSVDGSIVTNPDGSTTTTANGSETVFVNGKPVNFEGNKDANGSPRVGGSKDTFSS